MISPQPRQAVSVAVIGYGQHGKSTLVNNLRGIRSRDSRPNRAPVHIEGSAPHDKQEYPLSLTSIDSTECPPDSESMDFPSCHLVLVDVPGAGHFSTPLESYIFDFNLQQYDCFLITIAPVMEDANMALAATLANMGKRFWFVCPKFDVAVKDAREDGRVIEEDALFTEMKQQLCFPLEQMFKTTVFLVSSLDVNRNKFDMPALRRCLSSLRVSMFAESEVPAQKVVIRPRPGLATPVPPDCNRDSADVCRPPTRPIATRWTWLRIGKVTAFALAIAYTLLKSTTVRSVLRPIYDRLGLSIRPIRS